MQLVQHRAGDAPGAPQPGADPGSEQARADWLRHHLLHANLVGLQQVNPIILRGEEQQRYDRVKAQLVTELDILPLPGMSVDNQNIGQFFRRALEGLLAHPGQVYFQAGLFQAVRPDAGNFQVIADHQDMRWKIEMLFFMWIRVHNKLAILQQC